MAKKEQALVFYSRLPTDDIIGKTRIGKEINDQSLASKLARALITDLLAEYCRGVKDHYDLIFYYKGNLENYEHDCPVTAFIPQIDGEGLSLKHIHEKLLKKYEKVVIVGSDIPGIALSDILASFEALKKNQCVIIPVEDGGYGLIGMNQFYDLYSDVSNWDSRSPGYDLMKETLAIAEKKGIEVKRFDAKFDIDSCGDVERLWGVLGSENMKHEYLKNTLAVLRNNKRVFRL